MQVHDIFAKRPILSNGVLFVDSLQLEGTISYIVNSYDRDGKMTIEAILISNSFEKIALNLQTLDYQVLFVDQHLIEFIPHAYISRSSLHLIATTPAMSQFLTTDLYLKLLIERQNKEMNHLYKYLDRWKPKEPVLHFGFNTYERTLVL